MGFCAAAPRRVGGFNSSRVRAAVSDLQEKSGRRVGNHHDQSVDPTVGQRECSLLGEMGRVGGDDSGLGRPGGRYVGGGLQSSKARPGRCHGNISEGSAIPRSLLFMDLTIGDRRSSSTATSSAKAAPQASTRRSEPELLLSGSTGWPPSCSWSNCSALRLGSSTRLGRWPSPPDSSPAFKDGSTPLPLVHDQNNHLVDQGALLLARGFPKGLVWTRQPLETPF